MAQPMIGHLDPAFLKILDRVQGRLRTLFGTENAMTLPLSTTGSGGMEACFGNLIEPGDAVVIGINGVFGNRMSEVAGRLGADVTRVEAEWGEILDDGAMAEAIDRVRPRAVAFVHAETSTGVHQPVEAIAQSARDVEAFVILDCVTSLAGLPVRLDDWGVDAAYSGTQKCLSCPPGLSPASFSARAVERAGSRTTKCTSWYLDINLLAGYFGGERVYHHTAPISSIFALDEGLRLVEEEGLEARAVRHRDAAERLIAGLAEFGFVPLVDEAHRLPMLTSVRLPDSVKKSGEAAVRRTLLSDYEIEVGGGLGALAGEIWRIGLMGENARPESVDRLLEALRKELR
jgi:alanine-glyoxylate transaminase/serine-glyoxylate transaminase/serine-pyruvate transaminase